MVKQVSKMIQVKGVINIDNKKQTLKRAIWKDPDIGTFIYNEYGRVPVEICPLGGWMQSSDWVPYRRMDPKYNW